jgi:hypothetical protein
VDGSNVANLTMMIMQAIFINKNNILNLSVILKALIFFGVNGVNVFEGFHMSVMVQI